jgi:ribosomal protein S18 acetylase RimI-like enzyme
MDTVKESILFEAPMITDVIAEALTNDPTRLWAIPHAGARKRFWALLVTNALRYPYVLRTNRFEAVSVWIPPNAAEISAEDEERLPELISELVGERSAEVLELLQSFDDTHPREEPHYYLSLLGTKNASRGHGIGMALLKEGLERIDVEKMPAYLESSNPINNDRYQSVGFVPVNSFQAPGNGPVVTGMWRHAR